ncbi:DUF4145 domain-containing protein [Jeongeupia wiesaeckerbachi]|uniref:DUF4145 domain-containing protein n=1 Tax=Jeongeupia wiesaeckerbachi TaxID=3051218 RepID=UPI003D809583
MTIYVAPTFNADAFNCPFCNAFAHMGWTALFTHQKTPIGAFSAWCKHCQQRSIWRLPPNNSGFPDSPDREAQRAVMLYPIASSAPVAHVDLPDDCRLDYDEARTVAQHSPRAAAALLRLVIQKLCVHLGCAGKKIDEDIAKLVANGLPVRMQQAFDVVRVTGNNAVHPGEMDLQDNPELAFALFGLINMVVEEMITKPKALEAMFANLPAGALEAIERRNTKATAK